MIRPFRAGVRGSGDGSDRCAIIPAIARSARMRVAGFLEFGGNHEGGTTKDAKDAKYTKGEEDRPQRTQRTQRNERIEAATKEGDHQITSRTPSPSAHSSQLIAHGSQLTAHSSQPISIIARSAAAAVAVFFSDGLRSDSSSRIHAASASARIESGVRAGESGAVDGPKGVGEG